MILNPDFREFIQLLNEHKVKYLIVGGYALAYHGYPRFTQDIDFWLWTNKENAGNILAVLKDFGFLSLELKEEDFLDGENIIQLGYAPNRIDLITHIDGVKFNEAYENREVFLEDDLTIDFIGIDQLIQNKKASGRLQDLADVEILEKIKKEKDSK